MQTTVCSLDEARSVLRIVWGYDDFRPEQREPVRAALAGGDLLAVLPTGAGKSVCFQVPALLAPRGSTLVISPLIALIEDQVLTLSRRGVRAAAWTSATPGTERRRIRDSLREGTCPLLYASPEGLLAGGLSAALEGVRIARIVADEAHCVSEWGHDFRPAYRRIGQIRSRVGHPPLSAFTATATARTRRDLSMNLGLEGAVKLIAPVDRTNLRWHVRDEASRQAAFDAAYRTIRRLEAAIVYCGTRSRTVEVARALRQRGVRADAYHAGLPANERADRQARFLDGATRVVCATSAFGMGIDHPRIRAVVHLGLPPSLESYVQEAGRAGRDRRRADCILIRAPGDARHQLRLALASWPRVREVERMIPRGHGTPETLTVQDRRTRQRSRGWFGRRSPSPHTRQAVVRLLVRAGVAAWTDDGETAVRLRGAFEDRDGLRDFVRAGRQRAADRAVAVRDYAESRRCRRAEIARYFGEGAPRCHGCDNCGLVNRALSRSTVGHGSETRRLRGVNR